MRLASDWYASKTFWAAIAVTVPIAILCVSEKRFPNAQEITALSVAWGFAFKRDADAKMAEGRLPGQEKMLAEGKMVAVAAVADIERKTSATHAELTTKCAVCHHARYYHHGGPSENQCTHAGCNCKLFAAAVHAEKL